MAMIGHIKEVSIEDGQITAIVETGTGQAVTVRVMAVSGAEFYPMPGDSVLCHRAGQEVVVSAVLHGDASTERGEGIMFSRNESGDIVANIHLKADGKVIVKPTTGVEIGNASDFVAMAAKVDALWTALWGVINKWTPVYEGALRTSFLEAFPTPGPSSVASTNLKAD
jgi:hypothetical protein